MSLHLPDSRTVQWGAGRGLIHLVARLVIFSYTHHSWGRLHQRYLNCQLVNLRLTLSGD